MGARGVIPTDYTQSLQAQRAAEGLQIFFDFFANAL
jgi:hypothetical protein